MTTDFADREMKLRESEKSLEVSLIIIPSFLKYYAFSFCFQVLLEVKTKLLPPMYLLSHIDLLVSPSFPLNASGFFS